MRKWLVLLVALCGLIGPVAQSPAVGQRYTPIVMSVTSGPQWFKGTDGSYSLVYELRLTNGFGTPVKISSIGVRDGDGKPLVRLAGTRLRRSLTLLADPTKPTLEVPGSTVAVAWMQLRFAHRSEIPSRIEHVLTVRPSPGLPVPRSIADVGGRAKVDLAGPVVIGPPLVGDNWVAVGSCCDGPHRRALQPVNGRLFLGQRFAVDWNGMDAEDRFVNGDPDTNAGWTFYGKPVVAVADATVVEAVDRFPEQVPNDARPVTLQEADGNYVILKIGPHQFVGYAHLQHGSVAVRAGQHVRRGDPVGALGNSGSSTGPHLHFQVMDAPSLVAANGLPFVIDRFTEVGTIPPLSAALARRLARGLPAPIDRHGAGPQVDALPLGRDVVDFP
ncbi:MAG: M23 family metallopeptidase [Actinobacteria bacterium]|nr:M23 family metallopeptidase [Actinomycetota bacterium]